MTRSTVSLGGTELVLESVSLAGLPFDGPIGAVRVALIGGTWKVNPTYQELELATFDVVVAGRKNDQGQVDVLMVEGEAPEGSWERIGGGGGGTAPTEEVVAEGLEVAKGHIATIVDSVRAFVAQAGVTPRPFEPTPAFAPETWAAVQEFAGPRLAAAL